MKKIDIKDLFIIILSVVLIGFINFTRKKQTQPITDSFDKKNAELKIINDSLMSINGKLICDLELINIKIDSLKDKLEDNKTIIKKLNDKKHEIPKYINTLSGDDVASSISNIIEKSKN